MTCGDNEQYSNSKVRRKNYKTEKKIEQFYNSIYVVYNVYIWLSDIQKYIEPSRS